MPPITARPRAAARASVRAPAPHAAIVNARCKPVAADNQTISRPVTDDQRTTRPQASGLGIVGSIGVSAPRHSKGSSTAAAVAAILTPPRVAG